MSECHQLLTFFLFTSDVLLLNKIYLDHSLSAF